MRHRIISVAHGCWCATEILDFLWRIFCPYAIESQNSVAHAHPCATESQTSVAHDTPCATEFLWVPRAIIGPRSIWGHSVAHRGWCAIECSLSVAHQTPCATESWPRSTKRWHHPFPMHVTFFILPSSSSSSSLPCHFDHPILHYLLLNLLCLIYNW